MQGKRHNQAQLSEKAITQDHLTGQGKTGAKKMIDSGIRV